MEIENGSDTGFGTEDSEDEVVEEWEMGQLKRKHNKDDSDDENEGEETQPRDKKKKKRKQEKNDRPPTAEELNRLRETENLFHSNLFRLQVEEMLKEVKFKEKNKKEFKKWFEKFREWILKIEDGATTYNVNDQNWLKKLKLKIPIPQLPQHTKGNYIFKKPNRVDIFGSYALGLTIGSKVTIDVLVEMPQSFFYKDDFLNSLYHRKRALYLCELVHHIQSLPELIEDIHFVVDEVDSLRPNVEIIPAGKIGKCVTVKLHLVPESNTFKLSRFSPLQSNVRSKWFFNDECSVKDTCPTPFYNCSLLSDLTACANHTYLSKALYSTNNIKDGIRLLKIWLHQRELDQGLSNLNGFLVTMLVAYLLKIKKLNIFMSSYQVFRIVCNYLSTAEWDKNGIIVSEESRDQNLPTMEHFHNHHNVVFVDVTGYHNLSYGMCSTVFQRVKHEAQLAIRALDDASANSFQVLFMTPVPFYRHYDHVILFHNEEALENISLLHSSKPKQLSHCAVSYPQIRQLISELLIRGLGKRVSQIHVKQSNMIRWKITKKPQFVTSLILGLNLNPEEYFSVLEKANENEMKEFQEFWGDKSELRRFQDGTITEAVVWNSSMFSEKRLICREIVTYLMKLKFGYADTDLHYYADQLDNYISTNLEEQSLKIISTYDKLAKELRELKDLPLDIINVQGTSPVNRYTDVYPPKPFKEKSKNSKRPHNQGNLLICVPLKKGKILPKYISPVDVTIQMGASSKWPQTLEGIKRIKAAFNIKLAESLRAQFNLAAQAFPNRVDVNKDGFVFRIKIACPFEIPLLQKSVDSYGLVKFRDTDESLKVEKESVHLPRLASALHGVHQEHNSFGSACCLVKRWVNSHLIDFSHISEEALELLVASLYLNPGPHEVPQQPQVAFFRFHYLMASTNWNTDCIILNINNEFTREDITEIESHFNTNRAELPPVFISTPHDSKKSIWTQNSPSPLILLRLVQLSGNVLRHVETQIYSKQLFDHKILFEPSYDVFDVLIHLSNQFNPRLRAITKKPDDDSATCVSKIPVNGFDPVQCFLKELRETFEDFALFFYDSYGGSVIGVVWKPDAFQLRDFKVTDLACRKYNSNFKKLEFNKGMVIEDFGHIGEGLVQEIVLNKR